MVVQYADVNCNVGNAIFRSEKVNNCGHFRQIVDIFASVNVKGELMLENLAQTVWAKFKMDNLSRTRVSNGSIQEHFLFNIELFRF